MVVALASRFWLTGMSQNLSRGSDTLDVGNVVPGSGGIRKVRWARKGAGKRGGVRVIYYSHPGDGLIWLLTLYAKSSKDNVPAHILKALKEELIDGYE